MHIHQAVVAANCSICLL